MLQQEALPDPDRSDRDSTGGPDRSWRVVGPDGWISPCVGPAAADAELLSCLRAAVTRATGSIRRNVSMPVPSNGLFESLEAESAAVIETFREQPPAGHTAEEPSSTASDAPVEHSILAEKTGGCRDIDSRLARIIDAWGDLPLGIQAAMLAMVESTKTHSTR